MFQKFKAALDNVSVWKKGIAVSSIPLLVLVVTLVLMAWHENVSRDAQDRALHSLQVKASLYQVLAILTDSETGVRGYMLWGDPVYLDSYNHGRAQVEPAIARLAMLVEDNETQSSYTKSLHALAIEKLDSLRTMVNNPPTALSPESQTTLRSQHVMVNIRALLREMEATEATLLDSRMRVYDQLLRRLDVSLIILFILALLYVLTASYIVWSSILKRINDLEDYARKVSRGQTATWEGSGEDELGMLGRSVQIMTTNLLAREEALRQTRGQLQKANESLAAQLRETQEVNQELEAFSYSVSHDLRAPLRHVAGFSELLQQNAEDLDPKNKRYLAIILSSVNQMGVLIDELLEFSRMGRTTLKSNPFSLNEVINQVLTDLSPEITQRNITWKVGEMPTVIGDKVMIRLVFQNLIANALKYSRERDPAIIEIHAEPECKPPMCKITIADNGVGFDMQYQEKLFRVFQRLHSSEEYEGTGIGLATVKRIVKRHGGDVSAQGEIGKGSQFTVTLPVKLDTERTK